MKLTLILLLLITSLMAVVGAFLTTSVTSFYIDSFYQQMSSAFGADRREFVARFGIVMLLDHFITDTYIDEVLQVLDEVSHDGYYVKMAVAWAISVCYVKFEKETMALLLDNALDDFTYNKSLQKITESFRVSKEDKARIRKMKRPLKK